MKWKILLLTIILIFSALSASAYPSSNCDCSNEGEMTCDSGSLSRDIYECDCDWEGVCLQPTCQWVVNIQCPSGQYCNMSAPGSCSVCTPNCQAGYCGDDGCEGTCSAATYCSSGDTCINGACCTPTCAGKECGRDGCWGWCTNTCASDEVCNVNTCCKPNCPDNYCGPDGCGGTCGTGCPSPDQACNPASGKCDIIVSCTPECSNKRCGDSDGCGGICGCASSSPEPHFCSNGNCITSSSLNPPPCECGDFCPPSEGVCYPGGSTAGPFSCTAPHGMDTKLCTPCNYWKGERCNADWVCNPSDSVLDCETVTNYKCIHGHCCDQDEIWDVSQNRCAKIICYLPGGATTDPDMCCQPPNTPQEQYLNVSQGHCCPKDYEWSDIYGECIRHDPCFKATSDLFYCNYHAPDSPLFSFLGPWLSTNPQCIDLNPTPKLACCFLGEGLFGWVAGEDFYYYHEQEPITLY